VSVSELTAALLKELLSDEIDGLSRDYYKRVIEKMRELEEKAELRGEAEFIRNTLRYLYLYRLEKEISYLRRHGELPRVELPEEEMRVLDQVRNIISIISGEEAEEEGEGPEPVPHEPAGETVVPASKPRKGRRDYEGTLVVFLQPHPKILDKGLAIGPFAKGDIAYIPKKFARELEEKGIVEVLGGD